MPERSSEFKEGAAYTRAGIIRHIRKTIRRLRSYASDDQISPLVADVLQNEITHIELGVALADHRAGGIGHKPRKKKTRAKK